MRAIVVGVRSTSCAAVSIAVCSALLPVSIVDSPLFAGGDSFGLTRTAAGRTAEERPGEATGPSPVPAAPESAGERMARAGARLKSADPKERIAAISDVGALGSVATSAIPALVELLGDTRSVVVGQGTQFVGEMEPDEVYPISSTPARQAAELLARLGLPAAEPLLAALPGTNAASSAHAELALISIGKPAVPGLIKALGGSDTPARMRVIRVIRELRDPAAVESLVAVLGDAERDLRLAAVEALGRIADPRAAGPLIAFMGRQRDTESRRRAIGALGLIGDRAAVGPLLAVAETEKDAGLRKQAIEALACLGGTNASRTLIAAAADPDQTVAVAAVSCLGGLRDPDAVATLAPLAKSADRERRQAALDALRRIGTPRAEDVLEAEGVLARHGVFRDYRYEAVSPDGRQVAFMSARDSRNGNPKLFLRTAGSAEEKRITHGPQIDSSPVWSPDGRELAFISTRDSFFEIYAMDVDSGETRRLTYHRGGKVKAGSLRWSKPDAVEYERWAGGGWKTHTAGVQVDFGQLDLDGDGIPNRDDPDMDGDGIANDKDNAALVPNQDQCDEDRDGKGDAVDQDVHLRAATYDPLCEEPPYVSDTTTRETGCYVVQFFPGFPYGERLDAFLKNSQSTNRASARQEAVVIGTRATKSELESCPDVRWVGTYQPAERSLLHPRDRMGDAGARVALHVWILADTKGVRQEIERLGGKVGGESSDRILVIDLPLAAVENLLRIPDVEYVQTPPVYHF